MVPSYDSWSQSPTSTPAALKESQRLPQPSSSYHDSKDKPKKPRHRHSAYQLAALNELYERDEHPALEERTSLAEQLGMEVKTVNAWFQNKRASTKKRSTKAGGAINSSNSRENNAQCELPPISTLLASVAPPSAHPSAHFEYDELSEDDYSDRLPHLVHHRQQSAFYAGNPRHRHLFDSETSMPRKGRSRPSAAQTEELRKLYDANQHPSKEEREELGLRIGMRYQSVTNWFQNQRSIAKKRKEDEEAAAASGTPSASSSRGHTFSSFPPSSSVAHPSLAVPPTKGHPSLPSIPLPPRARRSPSTVSLMDSRASSPRPSPYSAVMTERASSVSSRSRRTRPEPYQLEALKKLFQRTATPSIEERGALALEINMDVGKVTNWFRNLRQSSRKRSKQVSGSEEDDDVSSYNDPSRNVSREGSPISVDPSEDYMVTDRAFARERFRPKLHTEDSRNRMYTHASNSRSSDMASEEDFQEAVTPSPLSSPYPAVPVGASQSQKLADYVSPARRDISVAVGALSFADIEKTTGVKVDDAILLLNFSNSVVR
ncbi:uncharacterized protein PHACADRAFT_248056 [Phanerochaete carnosa HHB-10118-sp]|uniref:Homeobox domain-containing protein n=1 Tax=Phanerochaete carnosa (strain HHB-10118-sp) TaxID=650164 RepID=K5WPQ5_PHACS|nr:uncharacterized protein PHACADRAFT_248056 [Phanerochaete carnosa HHB-10118-sp]EKM61445.1 hypothetical protein PHACADRAFT_248056 [Phanerochaete carnosa HHB-10118-sp]